MISNLKEAFIRKIERRLQSILAKKPNALIESGNRALLQALGMCENVFFSEGTVRMLAEHFNNFEKIADQVLAMVGDDGVEAIYERALSFRGLWLWFYKPFNVQEREIAALFCFQPHHYLATGRDGFQLYLIGSDAEIMDILSSQMQGDEWTYEYPFHSAQCTACSVEQACEMCGYLLVAWGQIFALSAIIAGQYLAHTRYEEKAYTSMRHVKREKSNKERRVLVKHIFKVIDANEIIIQVPVQEEKHEPESRGSWIDGADVVYEDIRTRPFARTYRHPRYVHMRGQSTPFPQGVLRRQPIKADNLGKHITKVKASEYED